MPGIDYDEWWTEKAIKEMQEPWGRNFYRYRVAKLRKMVRSVGISKIKSAIDIGSGISLLGEVFHPSENIKITAIDISPFVVDLGSKIHPHVQYIVDDAQSLKVTGQWDLLYAGEIIEHLRDPELAFSNWVKLVSLGKYFIISTPNPVYHGPSHDFHCSLITPKKMRRYFQ